METNKELWLAFAQASDDFLPVQMSGNNSYHNNKYSTLQDLYEATNKALKANGLKVFDTLEIRIVEGMAEPLHVLSTVILHAPSGQREVVASSLVKGKNAQEVGIYQTYYSRYHRYRLFGIQGMPDNDANDVSTEPAPKSAAKTTVKPATAKTQPLDLDF